MTGKRGRPKGAVTLEKERMEALLRNRPSHIPLMTVETKKRITDWIGQLEATRREILKDYKTSATIPDEHAYNMASLGGDNSIRDDIETLRRDESLRGKAQIIRDAGGDAVRSEADTRAKNLCTKNRILLGRMKPFGPLTLSDVASKIQKEWAVANPDSLLPGESNDMKERGLLGAPPDTRTIKNYIQRASPFPEQRVGKTSWKKK